MESAPRISEYLRGRVEEAKQRLNELMDQHHDDALSLNQQYQELVSLAESSRDNGDEQSTSVAMANLERFEVEKLGMKPKKTEAEL